MINSFLIFGYLMVAASAWHRDFYVMAEMGSYNNSIKNAILSYIFSIFVSLLWPLMYFIVFVDRVWKLRKDLKKHD
jgi:hypothetical protein